MAQLRSPAVGVTSLLGGVILALTVLGVLVLGGGQAQASHVDCGDTITTDTTLDSDLVNCPNNGIVIGADDITLRLGGHRIDGDAAEAVGCDPDLEICDVGVANDGHDGVVVRGGRVREFSYGVFLARASHNRALGIASSRNLFFGAVMGRSSRSLIRNSSFSQNIPPEGDGIGLFGCRRIRIVDSAIRDNAGPGIHVDDSTKNVIKENLFVRNGPAILISGADRNRVRDNQIRGGGVLVGPGDRNVIAGNRVVRASEGIAIEDGRGNLVAHNFVVHATGRSGIRLGIGRPSIGGADNVVRRNRVKDSHGDGFHVYKKDGHSLLKGNVARGAAGDGFDVERRSTKLTRNRAVRNGGLGIEAVRGVIDGGGNVARHNGNPLECTNIVCS
jgi:parallel beta-helix repeat protein